MSDNRGRLLPPPRPASRPLPSDVPSHPWSSHPSRGDTDTRPRLSSSLSSVSSLPDLKKPGSKRPRFVARASQYLSSAYGSGKAKDTNYFAHLDVSQKPEPIPLERIIGSVQQELLSQPYRTLGADKNGCLLRILEGHRALQAERDLLVKKLEDVVVRHDKNVDMLEEERRGWKQDEEMFRAEVKRLEIMIAEGRTGLSQVALARQHSLIRPRSEGRPRKGSDKSEAAVSYVSTVSSRSGKEVTFHDADRPTTPSQEMKKLSKDIKSHRSFLSLDFLPSRPPSRVKGASLAEVEVPSHWRKKSELTSAAPSLSNSPTKTISSDFSSDGGDLLPDELDQQSLDNQAILHVAKLMAGNQKSDIARYVELLQDQIAGKTSSSSSDGRNSDEVPTFRRPQPKNLAVRRGTEAMHIDTSTSKPFNLSNDNVRPATAKPAGASHHSRRPFSFYAGDDKSIMSAEPLTAPPVFPRTVSSESMSSQTTSPGHLLKRHSSLIPGPVPEHVLARPRREASSSSVITSLQRSPLGDASRPLSLAGAASGSSGSLTRASSVSVLGDRTSERGGTPGTPRLLPLARMGSARTSVQNLVMDLEMKSAIDASLEMSSKKEGGKKGSPNSAGKGREKENVKKENAKK